MSIGTSVSGADILRMQFSLLLGVLKRNLVLGNIIAPAFLVLLINPYVEFSAHVNWLIFCLGLLFVRFLCLKGIERLCDSKPNIAYIIFNLSLLINASLWPICWLNYFNPEFSTEIVFLLTFVVLCVLSGGSAALVIQPSSLYVFIASTLTPYIYLLYSLGEPVYIKLAVVLVLYALGIVFLTTRYVFSIKGQLEQEQVSFQLVEQYRKEKETAINAEKEKARFLASASHDLRQPLHALNMFISLLQRRLKDVNSELIQNINIALNDLTILFNALLDTSRLDSGDVEIHQEEIDLSELIAEIIGEYKIKASEKGLSFRCHIRPVEVTTDRVMLLLVLRNLLDNAVKFTNSGGVLLSLRERKEGVSLQVWDTGIGIEKRYQKSVFKEFIQLNNSGRDRSRGVGLGLANARKLCSLLGFHLTISSEFGRGSMLNVMIPAVSNIEMITEDNLLMIHDDARDLEDIKILYIENEASVMSTTKSLMIDMGANVLSATHPDDAFLLTKEKPDVIISDYHLGISRTGVEVASELSRVRGQQTPVIILTSEVRADVRAACDEHKWPLLSKPIDPQMLKRMIIEVL